MPLLSRGQISAECVYLDSHYGSERAQPTASRISALTTELDREGGLEGKLSVIDHAIRAAFHGFRRQLAPD